jgi:hypothetical protein
MNKEKFIASLVETGKKHNIAYTVEYAEEGDKQEDNLYAVLNGSNSTVLIYGDNRILIVLDEGIEISIDTSNQYDVITDILSYQIANDMMNYISNKYIGLDWEFEFQSVMISCIKLMIYSQDNLDTIRKYRNS